LLGDDVVFASFHLTLFGAVVTMLIIDPEHGAAG
jgi:hypothetical protein